MREIRMCVVFLPPANEKKISRFSVWRPLGKKTRERTREKRDLSREISSVLLLSLVALLINSLERTKEREIREEL